MPKPKDWEPNEPIEHKPMRPLFAYYGGKQKMASKIVDILPRHTVYVEPFCGGAAVFFKKPWPPVTNKDHYREVLNDKDLQIINLFKVVQNPDAFAKFQLLVSVSYSRHEYKVAWEPSKLQEISIPDPILAAAYYTNVQQSFANKLYGGWGTSVYGKNESATWLNNVQRLPQYLDRMLSTHLECNEAIEVIKRWDSPQTLFYCDPPYLNTDQGHYDGYSQEDFNLLCQTLNDANGSFILSNYQNSTPDSFGWDRVDLSTYCSSSGKGKVGKNRDKTKAAPQEALGNRKRTECLWIKDRSDNARKECKEIWRKWAAKGFQWGGDKRDYT